jgi:DNA-binding response OmpR family regulator
VTAASSRPGTGVADDPAGRGSVLVVDDDEMIVGLVGHALAAAGYRVVTAATGSEALARVAEALPDLIVSDVNMPDMDGFTLVQRLRENPRLRSMPLLFLTSRAEASDVVAGMSLGADDYLFKPFDIGELVARVDAKRLRPPVPFDDLPTDRRTGLAARFVAETGTTPHKWLSMQRVLHARNLLEETDLGLESVATRSGFGTAALLRHHFRRVVGVAPQDYRRTFSST